MENKPDKKSTSIRLESELRRRVDQKLLDRKYGASKLTFEGAVHEALELWVKSGQLPTRQMPPSKFPEAHRKWHELLDAVLSQGGQDAIEAVQSNLTVFDRYVRARPQKKEKTG